MCRGSSLLDQAIFTLTSRLMHHESLATAALEKSLEVTQAEHGLQVMELQLQLAAAQQDISAAQQETGGAQALLLQVCTRGRCAG
jgi:putative NADPH-quinone reductase